ncbi:hypothetical protein M0802_010851 [Mischocyttarus mexicanus]|nr:hypothetical protein M0802_010851 [Mischocyttarus mexicanus]
MRRQEEGNVNVTEFPTGRRRRTPPPPPPQPPPHLIIGVSRGNHKQASKISQFAALSKAVPCFRSNFKHVIYLVGLVALCSSAIELSNPKLSTKLSPVNDAGITKDLDTAASDRTFLISKDYGQPGYGGYGGYGNYPGSVYIPGYRGTGVTPGYNRVYPIGSPGGIIGGGHTGYGYYGNSGYNPYYNYGGSGVYGGGYGGSGGYGSLGGLGGYDNSYLGYGNYDRYGGQSIDGYGGYGSSGYGGSYGSTYGIRNNYDPYGYRGNSYGSYAGYPSGYRGYS